MGRRSKEGGWPDLSRSNLRRNADRRVIAARVGADSRNSPSKPRALKAAGFSPRVVAKIGEEGPTVLDVITQGDVDLVLNTMSNIYADPSEEGGPVFKDGFEIRRAAVERRIPCLTSLDTASALLESESAAPVDMVVRTIDEWRAGELVPH